MNRYIYTINNPLMYVDASGHWLHALVGAVVGAVAGAVTGVVSEVVTAAVEKRPVSLKKAAVNAAAGAAGGAVAGAVFATTGSVKLASVAGGAAGGAVGGFVGTVADGGSVKSALVNAGKGAITGAVGGLVGGSVGGVLGSKLVGSVVGSVAGGAAGQATSTLLNGGSVKDAVKNAFNPKNMLINAVTGLVGYGVAKVTSAGGARAERYVVDKTAAAKAEIQKFACGDAKKVTAQDPIENVTPDVHEVVEDLTPEVVDTPDGVNGVGDEGGTVTINPNEIRFSQSSVNGSAEIVESMQSNGWAGDPIDVVQMPDGLYTTIDNTRVVAARQAGIDAQAKIHTYDELLPAEYVDRFTTSKGVSSTWGDAISLRIGKQNATFRHNNTYGSLNMDNIK